MDNGYAVNSAAHYPFSIIHYPLSNYPLLEVESESDLYAET